jgi:glycosyltransferase involved in cell wall biosynthesis
MKTKYLKKICFVSHGLSGGGMERALVSLANYFAENEHEVTILNIYKTEIFFDLDTRIRVIWPDFERTNRVLYILRLLPFIRRNIKNIKPDVVLSFGETFNSYVVFASAFLKTRIVLTNRMWPQLRLGFPADNLNRILYRFADGVIAQTQTAKEIIKKKAYNRNIIVIPNSVVPINANRKEKKQQIVSVGRLTKAKGHTILLKAFAKLQVKEWSLHLIGDGSERQSLEREANALEIADKVYFHGHLKDFSTLLAESEIFVLPSLFEGFPNALIEAMSLPLACISSDCIAGPGDIIQHGVNGILVKPGDVPELTTAIEKLISEKAYRDSLAKEAYKVRSTYDFETIAHRYLEFMLPEGIN